MTLTRLEISSASSGIYSLKISNTLILAGLFAKLESRNTARRGLRLAISLTTLSGILADIGIEAGDEIAVVIGMYGTAFDLFRSIGHGQRQSPVDQAAEQQIKVGAVFFDIGDHVHKIALVIVVRRIVDILHVAVIQLEDAEAGVEGELGI